MISLDWDEVTRAGWQELLARGRSGLQQGWSYREALRGGGVRVVSAVVRDGSGAPLGCFQVADRHFIGAMGAAFLLRGPVWFGRPPDGESERALMAEIRTRLQRTMMVWAPEEASGRARRAVITGYSTCWLDLALGPDVLRARLAGDWRHRLRQAEQGGLAIGRSTDRAAIDWLLDRNEAYRRQVGYRGPTRAFLDRLAGAARAAGELLLLVAYHHGDPVAGTLILRHGCSATYEVGYVTADGRRFLATHLLLWRAVELLGREGVRWLDLGGIATDQAPGIARFKLGMGAEVATLPGTFLVRD